LNIRIVQTFSQNILYYVIQKRKKLKWLAKPKRHHLRFCVINYYCLVFCPRVSAEICCWYFFGDSFSKKSIVICILLAVKRYKTLLISKYSISGSASHALFVWRARSCYHYHLLSIPSRSSNLFRRAPRRRSEISFVFPILMFPQLTKTKRINIERTELMKSDHRYSATDLT